jgi:nucleoid DNA-binding protein
MNNKINLENLSEVYLQVAKELGISKFLVENTVKHFYSELRENLTNPKFESIHVHHLGKFRINQGALRKLLRHRFTLRDNKELREQFINLLKEKYKNEFKVVEPQSSDEGSSFESGSN